MNKSQKIIKFLSVHRSELKPFAIDSGHGNIIHVYDAGLIRLIAEALRSSYEVIIPKDNTFGSKQPHGNWSGMIGMLRRSEADLAMCGIPITEERHQAISFSYPHLQSELTFITEKPEPLPVKTAIFRPFETSIWIILLLYLVTVAFIYYILASRRFKYNVVLFRTFESLLEKGINLKINRTPIRLLTMFWISSVCVISYSYKAVLLGFLSIPTMTGIRDISDLSQASMENSITCFTFKGSYVPDEFAMSDNKILKPIGECLRRNVIDSRDVLGIFFNSPSKKVFVGGKHFLKSYERDYVLSKDSFFGDIRGIPYSRNFCCPKRLNRLINIFAAAGLLEKIRRDEHFFIQLSRKSKRVEISKTIKLDDISASFYILLSGWALGLLALIVEIIAQKHYCNRNNFKYS